MPVDAGQLGFNLLKALFCGDIFGRSTYPYLSEVLFLFRGLGLDIDFFKIILSYDILIKADDAGYAFAQGLGMNNPSIAKPAGGGLKSHTEFIQPRVVIWGTRGFKGVYESAGSNTAGIIFNHKLSRLALGHFRLGFVPEDANYYAEFVVGV